MMVKMGEMKVGEIFWWDSGGDKWGINWIRVFDGQFSPPIFKGMAVVYIKYEHLLPGVWVQY